MTLKNNKYHPLGLPEEHSAKEVAGLSTAQLCAMRVERGYLVINYGCNKIKQEGRCLQQHTPAHILLQYFFLPLTVSNCLWKLYKIGRQMGEVCLTICGIWRILQHKKCIHITTPTAEIIKLMYVPKKPTFHFSPVNNFFRIDLFLSRIQKNATILFLNFFMWPFTLHQTSINIVYLHLSCFMCAIISMHFVQLQVHIGL